MKPTLQQSARPPGFPHPRKTLVDRATARAWPAQNCRLTRKYDGEFTALDFGGRILLGDLVRPKSGGFFTAEDRLLLSHHGEFFAAWDCAGLMGADTSMWPTRERNGLLNDIFRGRAPGHGAAAALRVIRAEAVTDVDAAFAAGAEGVVRNEWDAPYGEITVCKRGEIYWCQVVVAPGARQSVEVKVVAKDEGRMMNDELKQPQTGSVPHSSFRLPPSSLVTSRVPCKGPAANQVRVGDLIRVEGLGLTGDGKIREPKLCREWRVTPMCANDEG